jgi:hypothetical protein
MNLVSDLFHLLAQGRLALFIGTDVPQAATGLPSRADLARLLAGRLGITGPPPPWPEVAAQYEANASRNTLILWLQDQLAPTDHRPGPVYHLLAQLPITTFITTTYDTWLHESLEKAGRRPNLPVVGADSLGFLDPDRPTVVKLFGVYDRPVSLVLTAADLRRLAQTRSQLLAGLVHPTLGNQSVLILGQDLRDTYFQTFYQTALFQRGTLPPPAYAAWQGLADWEKQTWREQGVRVIETPAMDLLGELLGAPQTAPASVESPTTPRPSVTVARAPQPISSPTVPQLPPANLYHDFEILVGDRQRRRYPVHVITSPAGEGEGTFTPPFVEDELQSALARMEGEDTDEALLADFGNRLFAALFTGDVRARYAESVGLTGADAGLRIRLRLDPPELQEWPWELARDPEKREFLVLSKRSLVTRYLHVPRPTPPLEVEPPLRVLVVVAAPRGLRPLDVDDEVARIRQVLRLLLDQGMVNLLVEPHVTKRGLRQRLLDDVPHVLHYVGHGDLTKDRGVLILEDSRGRADRLDGPTLGTLLKGSSVRLAVLNACLSAREAVPEGPGFRGRRAAFMGLGPALVDAGLGAVVAMQFSMVDDSARVFAEDFYAMLARFKPVDECVSRAREALLLEVGLDRRDWATPVLFMRAPDGRLFASQATEAESIISPVAPSLNASQRRRLEQRRDELQGPLATYNRRIKALQGDIARELDGERRAVLEERLEGARKARERIQAELEDIERQLGRE